jgi:hypothetical protein
MGRPAMEDAPCQTGGAQKLSRHSLLCQMRDATVAALLLPAVSPVRAGQMRATLKAGVLRIGTYFVNPPFEFVSAGARVGGYFICPGNFPGKHHG